jgi:DMSO reductase anchor subunit
MHPAYSVILFTTASGAGYGLLVVLSLLGAFGAIPISRGLGIAGFAISFALITVGLLSSTLHLGRPERAWRALSQWSSSWLSREGIAAVVTFIPSGLLALTWIFSPAYDGPGMLLATASAAMALITVYCTGMIYASLPTIRQWHNGLVTPIYLILALATGAVLANALLTVWGQEPLWLAKATAAFLAASAALKWIYWRSIDTEQRTYSIESATGLGKFGKVRSLEPAHTQPNFVMREMGYSVARAHALKLRKIALLIGFAAPALIILLAPGTSPIGQIFLSILAASLAMLGVVVERWLFFAEAQHVVTLFYGSDRA